MNSLTDSFILPLIADVASAVTHEGLWPPFSAYLEIICDLSGCLFEPFGRGSREDC